MTARRKAGIEAGNANKKAWEDLTWAEIDRNYNIQCSKCRYRGMIGRTHCCDYIIITGRSRGCSALGCKRFERGRRTKLVVGCTINNASPTKKRVETGPGKQMKPSKTYLGKALEEYMIANHLNQMTLADRLGVNKATAAEWRMKMTRITDKNIRRIAGMLNVGEDVVRELIRKGMIGQPETGGEP